MSSYYIFLHKNAWEFVDRISFSQIRSGLLGVAIFDDSGFRLAELEGIATSETDTVGALSGVTQHVGYLLM